MIVNSQFLVNNDPYTYFNIISYETLTFDKRRSKYQIWPLPQNEIGRQMSDTIHQVYLEMPFFSKEKAACKTSLDYWLYTLIQIENLETLPFKRKKQLFEKLERLPK